MEELNEGHQKLILQWLNFCLQILSQLNYFFVMSPMVGYRLQRIMSPPIPLMFLQLTLLCFYNPHPTVSFYGVTAGFLSLLFIY